MGPIEHAEQRVLDDSCGNVVAQLACLHRVADEGQQDLIEHAGFDDDALRPVALFRLNLVHALLNVDEGCREIAFVAVHQRKENGVKSLEPGQRGIGRQALAFSHNVRQHVLDHFAKQLFLAADVIIGRCPVETRGAGNVDDARRLKAVLLEQPRRDCDDFFALRGIVSTSVEPRRTAPARNLAQFRH